MNIDERLRDALREADAYAPSPDLFARVQRTIEEDAAHRRRVRRVVAVTLGGIGLLATWLAATSSVVNERPVVQWWSIEIALTALLVLLVIVLGPLIKRFGLIYIADVFRANPATGARFLTLFDIAYYLVFFGYVLVTARYTPPDSWSIEDLGAALQPASLRFGGLLLLMGILHGFALASLPVIGLLFSSVWRRAERAALGRDAPPPDARAEAADRIARAVLWAFAVLALIGALLLAAAVVGGVG